MNGLEALSRYLGDGVSVRVSAPGYGSLGGSDFGFHLFVYQ